MNKVIIFKELSHIYKNYPDEIQALYDTIEKWFRVKGKLKKIDTERYINDYVKSLSDFVASLWQLQDSAFCESFDNRLQYLKEDPLNRLEKGILLDTSRVISEKAGLMTKSIGNILYIENQLIRYRDAKDEQISMEKSIFITLEQLKLFAFSVKITESNLEKQMKELYLLLICILSPCSAIFYGIEFPDVSESSYTLSHEESEDDRMDVNSVGSDGSIKYQKVKEIRGELKTYTKEMMGYFMLNYTDGKSALIIGGRSEIGRPSSVTGSLGKKKGDHLIAVSYYMKMLMQELRNKTVKEAIYRLLPILGGDHYEDKLEKEINSLISRGHEIAEQYEKSFKEGYYHVKVNEYIKQELIPTVVAIWNQRQGIAFLGVKTNAELGHEGGAVSAALKKLLKTKQSSWHLQKEDIELAADIYVSKLVDFAVVEEDKTASSDYLRMLSEGKRNNHMSQMVLACGHIIKNFLEFFSAEKISQVELTKLVIIKFLQKEGKLGSWFDYYQSNSRMLGDGIIVTIEGISDFLIFKVKQEFPLLIENELEVKSETYMRCRSQDLILQTR
jgi:hypothetical protein